MQATYTGTDTAERGILGGRGIVAAANDYARTATAAASSARSVAILAAHGRDAAAFSAIADTATAHADNAARAAAAVYAAHACGNRADADRYARACRAHARAAIDAALGRGR